MSNEGRHRLGCEGRIGGHKRVVVVVVLLGEIEAVAVVRIIVEVVVVVIEERDKRMNVRTKTGPSEGQVRRGRVTGV